LSLCLGKFSICVPFLLTFPFVPLLLKTLNIYPNYLIITLLLIFLYYVYYLTHSHDLLFQPIENYKEWRLLYFISFLLLVGFFVLNMFVGVVVENFHRCREAHEKEEKEKREKRRQKKLTKKLTS